MNILQLTVAETTAGQMFSGNATQKVSSSQGDDFRSVLNGLMDQSTGADNGTSQASTDPLLQAEDLKVQLEAILNSNQGSADGLGKNLLALVSTLLKGLQAGDDQLNQQSLLAALSAIVDKLGGAKNDDSNSLIALLSQLGTQDDGNSIVDKISAAIDGLPLSIKLKLSAAKEGAEDSAVSPEETALVQGAILAAIASQPIVASGQPITGVAGAVSTRQGFGEGVNATGFDRSNVLLEGMNYELKDARSISGEAVIDGLSEENALPQVDGKAIQAHSGEALTEGLQHAEGALMPQAANATEDLKNDQSGDQGARNGKSGAVSTSSMSSVVSDSVLSAASNGDSGNTQLSDQSSTGEGSSQSHPTNSNASQSVYGQVVDSAQTIAHQGDSSTTPLAQTEDLSQGFVEPSKLMNSIVKKLDILLAEGRSEARIKLVPEHLGELRIHLVMDGGSMKAVLDASNPLAKDLLEANLSTLKQSLEGQGLQIKEFEVSVNQQQNNQNPSFSRQHRFNNGYGNADSINDAIGHEIARLRAFASFDGDKAVNYLA